MTSHSWIRNLFAPSVTRPIRKAPPTRLGVVGLEDRTAPVIDLNVALGGTLDVNPVSSIIPAGYDRMEVRATTVPGLNHGTMYKVSLTEAYPWGSGAPNAFAPAAAPAFNQNRINGGQGFRYVNDGSGLGQTESIPIRFSNVTGTVTATDTLVIHINSPAGTPTITTQPAGLTMAVSGQTATLSVVAEGQGPLRYQWFAGITPNAGNPIAGATSSTFTTPVLSAGGQYMYWVKVSNAVGEANSLNATVNVSEATTTSTRSATVAYSRSPQTVGLEATVSRVVPQLFGIADGAVTFAATGVGSTGNAGSTVVSPGVTRTAGVLTIPGRTHAGVYPLSATYAGNIPLYLAASSDTDEWLTILKADQTISGFGAIPQKTYGDADFTIAGVSATSDPDAGGVTFTSLNPSVATVTGNRVKIVGAGTAVIVASQAGNVDWNPAPDVRQTLVVRRATPTVTAAGGSFTYDQNAHPATATATGVGGAPVAGTFTFTYNGSPTPPVNAGTYTVIARFRSSDSNYTDADSPAGTLVINRATPTVTVTGGTFNYDQNPHPATATATGVGGGPVSGQYAIRYNGSSTVPSAVGTYTVEATFTSTDTNYTNGFGTGTLTINPVPPTIATDRELVTVNEGTAASNSGTFDDLEGRDTVTLTASLGTVTWDTVAGTWTWSHAPSDGPVGPTDVIITVRDASSQATTTFALTVNNVAPTATLSNNGPVPEGSPATVTFDSPSDPSSADTAAGLRYSFALSAEDLATGYAAAGTASTASFTFTEDGSYTVYGRIFDKDGGFTDATTTVVVTNAAPTVTTFVVPSSGTEGGAVALSAAGTDPAGAADPLTFVWTVTRPGGSTFTLIGESAGFTPADDGNYGVSFTVSDGDGGTATQSGSVAVANVTPSIVISGATGVAEGSPYTLTLGAVTEPGSDTVSQYVVHWGDGTSNTYTTAGDKTHTYADGPTTRAITVDLVDEDGTHKNRANPLSVTVGTAVPSASVRGPASGVRGQPRSFTVSAGVVSGVDQAAGFAYAINWGDGSPVQTIARTVGNGTGVTVEHVYTASGKYTVTVVATDKDNASSPAASHTIGIVAVQMQGDDLVVGGTTGNEVIAVTAGNKDTVKTRVNGALLGTFNPTGKIVVYGQAGDDRIRVSDRVALPAWLHGGEGSDTLRGTREEDVLIGGAGNDVIDAGAGIDHVDGGDGDDRLLGAAGADILMGGAGDDTIQAGSDNDWVDGNSGDDVITGGSGHDTLFGGAGLDRVNGGDGRDLALGGEGDDTLTGGLGRDLLIGGLGGDSVSGSGGDILIAGTTAFDGNPEALEAILAEWSSGRSYTARSANLTGNGSGLRVNGNFFLKVSGPDATAFDDPSVDLLKGTAGSDWYFANLSGGASDQLSGRSSNEIVEELEVVGP
jgi:Ca2+-binding RTX toxin-like protein